MCNLPWTVGNIFLVAYYSKSKKQNALYIETTSDRQHLFQIYRCIKLPWIKWCSTSTDGLFTSESRECFHFFFSIPLLQLQLNLARVTSREIQMASLAVKFLTWMRHASIFFHLSRIFIFIFYGVFMLFVITRLVKMHDPSWLNFLGFTGSKSYR